MKCVNKIVFGLIAMGCFLFISSPVFPDDTCVFQVTADDLPPNIVLLLDSGAEMEQIVWHANYDNSTDFTPSVAEADQIDATEMGYCGTGCVALTLTNITDNDFSSGKIVTGQNSSAEGNPLGALDGNVLELKDVTGAYQEGEIVIGDANKGAGEIAAGGIEVKTPNGFFNDRGYGIVLSGGVYYLVDIPVNLELADHTFELEADSSDVGAQTGTWTINGRTITLPAEPFKTAVDEVIDNARNYRYSKNYLNWLFFATGAGSYIDESAVDDGTDLPHKSRFYYAKKAIMTVIKGTGYQAQFGIYYFTNSSGGSQAQPLKFAVKDDPDSVDNDGDGEIDEMDEILTSTFMNNINNMQTFTYSPLAEGLSTVGYYYSSPSSGAGGGYCQQNFSIVLSPGLSSEDQGATSRKLPDSLSDYDTDDGGIGEGNIKEDNTNDGVDNDGDGDIDEADEAVVYAIPINQNGSTYLDDVAHYLYANDIVGDEANTGALRYDAKTVSFTVGEVVTGGSSGARGTVTAVNEDAGAPSTTGTIDLESITGTFQDNEALTGNLGGAATIDGTLYESGEGYQNVLTYTIGFMGDQEGNLFLINTSNNGNGNQNLYDTSDPEYGKYHYTAESPDALSAQLLAAINSILSRTNTFTAPVVPVTRTTSGNRIYMAFFKPSEANFWEGNVTKFGISNTNEITDKDGNAATWPNGAIKDDAEPYWSTIDWADSTQSNYMDNASRNIYTYLGSTAYLTDPGNEFRFTNGGLTAAVMGAPTNSTTDIINYVRGADVFDKDDDGDTTENRTIITGDVLHSEPVVFTYYYVDGSYKTMVYFGANDGMLHAVLDVVTDASGNETEYGTEAWGFIPPDQLHRLKEMIEGSGHQFYIDSTPQIYFKDVNDNGIVEGDGDEDGDGSQDDLDGDGDIDSEDKDQVVLVCGERKGGTGYFALDVTDPTSPKYLWRIQSYRDNVAGTIEISNVHGTWQDNDYADHFPSNDPTIGSYDSYVNLDGAPVGSIMRYDSRSWNSLDVGDVVFSYRGSSCATGNCYSHNVYATIDSISYDAPYNTEPTTVISALGESWSEPRFIRVKTSDADTTGTQVVIIGGGYSSDNSSGKAVVAINALTGTLVKQISAGMSYSIASSVTIVDGDDNGFADKVYVGDLGGQVWRIGRFTYVLDDPEGSYSAGDAIPFPDCDENINNWTPQKLLITDNDPSFTRKFFYPPSVTLEPEFDLVFMGTGDREDACEAAPGYANAIYAVKDTHSSIAVTAEYLVTGTLTAKDLVDVTDESDTPPDLNDDTSDVDNNGFTDKGWFIQLLDASGNAAGEKVLAEGSVFYGIYYVTTFAPNDEPCVPGGAGILYALDRLTGRAAMDFNSDGSDERKITIGGGIPSKPVTIITDSGVKQYISVGSTNPDVDSEDEGAGIMAIDPEFPDINFFYIWWKDF